MKGSKTLISIGLPTSDNFEKNLDLLLDEINKTPEYSIVLAPEVVISGFCYDRMQEASDYSQKIINSIIQISSNKNICFSVIEKEKDNYFNNAYIISNKKIVYKRAKNRLFRLGDEHIYFQTDEKQEKLFSYQNKNLVQVDGLKLGVLICFELRFTDEWKKLLGCDVVLIPAQWGENRIEHFKTLSRALAITNQCFVINSNNPNLAKCNQIITPFGEIIDNQELSNIANINLAEIEKMRKYIVLKE